MATIPTFRTWTAGEVVTAAFFNSNVRDPGNFFLSWPVFEGRQTVAQSLANNTAAAITLDTEDVDTDNGHSTSTNTSRYTPQTAGRFQLSGGVGFVANATGSRQCGYQINGTPINASIGQWAPPTNGVVMGAVARTRTAFFNGSTDFVELFGLQASGAALNTDITNTNQSHLSVRMVGTT